MKKRLFCILLIMILTMTLCGCEAITAYQYKADMAVNVPILMYHHLAEESITDVTVTVADFTEQMQTLAAEGFHTVSFRQLIDYVDNGTPLPEKPVVLTFDDGYTSNLEIAAPILEQYGFCAEIAVIGENIGRQYETLSFFTLEDAKPWVERGILEIGAHSWGMHKTEPRAGMFKLQDETREEYLQAIRADTVQITDALCEAFGEATVFAYPYGYHSDLTERVLRDMGYRVTLTVESGINTVRQHEPLSLYSMKRLNVPSTLSIDAFKEMLQCGK